MPIYLSKSNQNIKDKIFIENKDSIYVVNDYIFIISEARYICKIVRRFFLKKREETVLLGCGGADINEFLQNFGVPFVKWVIQGLAWDFVSKNLLKNYKFLKTRKREYVEIIDLAYEPGTYHSLIFLIPNNLDDQKINHVLDDAGKILGAMKKIRYLFGSKEIIFTYNKYWHIKIKKIYQFS